MADPTKFAIKWPLQADGRGYYAPCQDEDEDIQQSMFHCLFISPAEQVMHMEGCLLHALVGDQDDIVFQSLARLTVKNVLALKEKRIVIDDVGITRNMNGQGEAVIGLFVFYHKVGSRLSQTMQAQVRYSK